jgi:adenylate cyclase
VEAYDLYLRGIYFEGKRSAESLAKGLDYLGKAAALDPRSATIFARLSSAYTLQATFGLEAPAVAMANARAASIKALQIDDTLAQAYSARSTISAIYDWDWAAADRAARLALQLNPRVPEIHQRYAFFCLGPSGRCDEALAHLRVARKMDPLSLFLNAAECAILFWADRFDAAIACGRKALEFEPGYYVTHMYLSWAYRSNGMLTEAIECAETAARLSGNTPLPVGGLGVAYATAGRKSDALRTIELLKQRPYQPSTSIAYVYAALKDFDQAFHWLETAVRERSTTLAFINVAEWDEDVAADPRFKAVVKTVGLKPR